MSDLQTRIRFLILRYEILVKTYDDLGRSDIATHFQLVVNDLKEEVNNV